MYIEDVDIMRLIGLCEVDKKVLTFCSEYRLGNHYHDQNFRIQRGGISKEESAREIVSWKDVSSLIDLMQGKKSVTKS